MLSTSTSKTKPSIFTERGERFKDRDGERKRYEYPHLYMKDYDEAIRRGSSASAPYSLG